MTKEARSTKHEMEARLRAWSFGHLGILSSFGFRHSCLGKSMSEPKMLIYAQCGRRHYATDDLVANVAEYKAAFGLPPATKLVGRVYRQFDASRNPTDPGEPIETALASAAELAAQASERAAHEVSGLRPDVGGPRPEAEQGAAYFVRGSVSENPQP
jgi:hypothetical protein